MKPIATEKHLARLTSRRQQIVATLLHLDKEQNEVEHNTDWLDQAAFENRRSLLDRLRVWYRNELIQVEKALDRIQRSGYGNCVACHAPIDATRLDAAPTAEYCAACQATRESLECA